MSIVVFKLRQELKTDFTIPEVPDDYRVELWRPSWCNFIPPGKGAKYILYWIFHFAGIFKNSDYTSLLLYKGQIVVSSVLVVPGYFKWPFMKDNDLQFTYVMTNKAYRGKGLAEKLLQYGLNNFNIASREFWYVTEESNNSSLRLCAKLGFGLAGKAKQNGIFKSLKLYD